MPGYDWGGGGRPRGRPWGGSDAGGPPRAGGYGRAPHGYDRGVYGEAYEGYAQGGYAGGGYGSGGYGRGADPRGSDPRRGGRGYDGGYGEAWQGGYAPGPFLPDYAYRRHPELDRAPTPRGDRWGYELDDSGLELDDASVLEAVRRRLYEDVWLDVERIDVEVEDGVVTLRGEVDDFLEVRYAWDDAWETEGVRGVVMQLAVRADQPRGDAHGDLLPQTSQGSAQEP